MAELLDHDLAFPYMRGFCGCLDDPKAAPEKDRFKAAERRDLVEW